MAELDKLKMLMSLCKCGVHLDINEHRNYYQDAKRALDEADNSDCPPEIPPEVRQKIVETDAIVHLSFYPFTPIGSLDVYHYDLEAALDIALASLEERR